MTEGLAEIRRALEDDPALAERVVGTDFAWEGKIFSVRRVEVELPDGSRAMRELVAHHGGAGVVAVRGGRVCLVRQYRVALGRMTLEIPAGKIDAGEDPEACAARELREETGLLARRLEPLVGGYGSPGFTDERTSVFFADSLEQGDAAPDEGELVNVLWLPVDDAIAAIREGLIDDGKTVMGLLAARALGML